MTAHRLQTGEWQHGEEEITGVSELVSSILNQLGLADRHGCPIFSDDRLVTSRACSNLAGISVAGVTKSCGNLYASPRKQTCKSTTVALVSSKHCP
jgi:hypothetical protein